MSERPPPLSKSEENLREEILDRIKEGWPGQEWAIIIPPIDRPLSRIGPTAIRNRILHIYSLSSGQNEFHKNWCPKEIDFLLHRVILIVQIIDSSKLGHDDIRVCSNHTTTVEVFEVCCQGGVG